MPYPNLFTSPESFDNAAWVKEAATVSADATTDPFGGSRADKILDTIANTQHAVSQAYAKDAGNALQLTLSVYLKAAEYTTANIYLFDGTNLPFHTVNLSTGATVQLATADAGGVIDAGGGWWRVWLAYTFGSGALTITARVFPNTGSSFAGTGTSGIYAFGARLEIGGGPGNFIASGGKTIRKSQVPAAVLMRAISRMPRSRR